MFSIRLKELRERKGLTQQEFASAFGISKGTIGMWESGAREPRNLDDLHRIADYFSVSVDYLLGRGEQETPSSPKGKQILVLGDVAAGIPIEAITDIIDYEEIDAEMAKTGEFFGLRIKGASMEPRMKEGDVVIVRQQETVENGDIAVVLVNGDSATVKKIKYGRDGITLVPTNPSYDVMFYSAAEVESLPVRVIGRVVELRAKF